MKSMIWLVFIKNTKSVSENDGLLINYQWKFFIARPENSTTYELMEVYTVKKKLFIDNFGTWNREHGLTNIPDISFYTRRIDLNGTELTTIAPEVKIIFKFLWRLNIFMCTKN